MTVAQSNLEKPSRASVTPCPTFTRKISRKISTFKCIHLFNTDDFSGETWS